MNHARMNRTYEGFLSSAGILLPSVAQPPLPLQEFLALQPLSLDLQPPLPLQEFWPLQACFSFVALSAFFSVSWAEVEAFPPGNRLEAWMLALVPASKPATAAPVSKKRFDFVIFPNDLLVNFIALHFEQPSAQRPLNHWA